MDACAVQSSLYHCKLCFFIVKNSAHIKQIGIME